MIDKNFLERVKPLKIDCHETGFKITSALQPGGCGDS
jgi:hypothetical protein